MVLYVEYIGDIIINKLEVDPVGNQRTSQNLFFCLGCRVFRGAAIRMKLHT